jgi:hypothetical protein
LLCDRQIVLAVDHRFALSNPALVSAPSKKLAWRYAPPVGAKTGLRYTASRKGAAVTILVAYTPLKNMVHGLLRT